MSEVKRARLDYKECPYVATIDKHVLNFDFEKVCSISLSAQNVYCCLVCGKYYQGRGFGTHAYEHSLEQDHHMFLKLEDGSVFCLPDNYEVNGTWEDIRQNLNPLFTAEEVDSFETASEPMLSVLGTEYIPGIVGLNKLGSADYMSSVIQCLTTVIPFRRWFLLHATDDDIVCMRLGELFRKLFNPKSFRSCVSPHEFLQAVSTASKKTFFNQQGDAIAFLSWLVAHLQRKLRKTRLIDECFTGHISVTTESADEGMTTSTSTFNLLVIDLPATPVFKEESTLIPAVSIYDLLSKFDGVTESVLANESKTYTIKQLPQYLILAYRRFTSNDFFAEKNATLVTGPIAGLDLSKYVAGNMQDIRYDLVAQVTHEGDAKSGSYKSFILNSPTGQWFELQDLRVKPVLPQQVALAEAYIQIYRRV